MIRWGFTILIIVFFTLFLSAMFNKSISADKIDLKINGKEIKAEIADNDEKRNTGLSGRKSLEKNDGMLFVFQLPSKYSFWMKDMRFPLDIIWIDENKKIIAISENISPETYPASFSPSEPVKYVLEVNAGWSETNEVGVGDVLEF